MRSSTRTHVLAALAGGLVAAVLLAALPVTAGTGDPLNLGTRNRTPRLTKLASGEGLEIRARRIGSSPLRLFAAEGTAPLWVNSTTRVDRLNADLVDGYDSSAFSLDGHPHDWSDLTSGVPEGLDDGDDDALGALDCGPGQVVERNAGDTAWECAEDDDTDTTLSDGEVLAAVTSQDGPGSGLDSDLLDGHDSTYFSADGHDHAGVYLPTGGTAADSDLLGGWVPAAYFRAYPAGSDGSPVLGANCLLHGGYLIGVGLDGSPLCGMAMGPGTFTDSGQENVGWDGTYFDTSQDVALGDLDGDGDLDAFAANHQGSVVPNRVWLNDGRGYLSDSGQALGNDDSLAVAIGDVDADGDLDALVGNAGDQNRLYLNDGSGTFTDSGQELGGNQSQGVAFGDLDGDGDLDAFIANLYSPASRTWFNDGSGTFTDSGQSIGSGNNSYAVALGDLDGDGDLDAFVANSQQANKVWTNDGNGTFSDSGQTLGDTSRYSYNVALGDVDGDGDLDAFVADSQGADRVWKNNGSGVFSEHQALGTGHSYGLDLGDVDGDGDLDAFVGDEIGDNLLWLNDGAGTFTDSGQTLEGPEGSWTNRSVALGDLDGDGDLDAFVANDGWWSTVWFND